MCIINYVVHCATLIYRVTSYAEILSGVFPADKAVCPVSALWYHIFNILRIVPSNYVPR